MPLDLFSPAVCEQRDDKGFEKGIVECRAQPQRSSTENGNKILFQSSSAVATLDSPSTVRDFNNFKKTKMYKKHHPLHIYEDGMIYFVTARTIKKENFFNTDEKKKILLHALKKSLENFCYLPFAWIILSNHYHLLFKTKKGENLGDFISRLGFLSSKNLNKLDNQKGRKVWFQYWDYCPRNEKDFYSHFNYIHHNMVKHKYVRTQEEVLKNEFCSYGQWIKEKGKEWMGDCFATYPILDFTVEGDE